MRIAVGGLHTECSTYSPLLQRVEDFKVLRDDDLLGSLGFPEGRFGDVTFCPIFHARAIPGGPLDAVSYAIFKTAFLEELKALLPLDGVLLIMHGAVQVQGLDDAEGDWISAVRDLIGHDTPIAVSYDLHGNVTQKIIDAIDIFAAYRTAPHIDVKQTHLRAADELVDMLRGGQKRFVAWAKIPVLLPGERTSTEDEPARSLYDTLPAYDLRKGVTDANLMVGYVWADVARATAAAVVTGTDAGAVAKASEEIALAYWEKRREFAFGVETSSLAICLDRIESLETSPVVLADSGDNPTGGGVGDRADVLAAWLERGLQGAVFAGICDPRSAQKAAASALGSSIRLEIGGALGSRCPVVRADAVLRQVFQNEEISGQDVLVEIAGNLVILTARRRPFHALADFRAFGIEPAEARVLVVKSGYLSPELAPIANPPLMALTDGAVNQDMTALENNHRPRPSFPFQDDFAWTPRAKVSARASSR